MTVKSDCQIGVSVDTGDRIVGAGFKDSNGKYATVTLDSSGNIPVSGGVADVTNSTTFSAVDQTVGFTSLSGINSIAVQVTGTFDAFLNFEASVDGTNYLGCPGAYIANGATSTTTASAGIWTFDVTGYDSFRVRCSTYTSGSPVVTLIGRSGTANNQVPEYSALTSLSTIAAWDFFTGAYVNPIRLQQGVQGSSGVVTSNTQRVTLATDVALPAGTNNIGDVDVLSIPSSIQGPGNPTIDSYTQVAINLAAGADQVLVSSAASKQIWVYGICISVNVAGTVSFQDEDNTAITGVMNLPAGGSFSHSPSGNFSMPMWKLGTDKDLEIDIVTSEVDGWLTYAIVSV